MHMDLFCKATSKSTYGAIHKAAGLTVPGCSIISTGTIPVEQKSVGYQWEPLAGMASGGHSCQWFFGKGW